MMLLRKQISGGDNHTRLQTPEKTSSKLQSRQFLGGILQRSFSSQSKEDGTPTKNDGNSSKTTPNSLRCSFFSASKTTAEKQQPEAAAILPPQKVKKMMRRSSYGGTASTFHAASPRSQRKALATGRPESQNSLPKRFQTQKSVPKQSSMKDTRPGSKRQSSRRKQEQPRREPSKQQISGSPVRSFRLPAQKLSREPSERGRAVLQAGDLDQEGNKLFEEGDLRRASLCYESALELKQQSLEVGKKVPVTAGMEQENQRKNQSIRASVATSINNVTYLKQRSGQASSDEIMEAYMKSLMLKRDTLGVEHLSVGVTLNNIGSVYYTKNEFEPALRAYQEAYAIMKKQLSENHLNLGTVLSNIGDVHRAMENFDDALHCYRRALDIRWSQLGPHDPKVVRLMELTASLETGIQPERGDVSDSENEEFVEEEKERNKALKEELTHDLEYFDLIEHSIENAMHRDKARVLKALNNNNASLADISESYLPPDDPYDSDHSESSGHLSVLSAPAT